ncbi:O-antigen ligase family protein [Curtobacterium sp. 20TX0008]|uniref:O-antigen ligase family protein n=1 Tax=Curtobacterium sp. 20TX0008 TaxID=3022018 RepID=UPI00232C37D2|nr:O-antigen ligase family protein [Curtobacterium sp. 20TX0008]MDB6428332.1 O-antigen ligase family protein [Curtobacterium sp. 20TX0008]
MRDVMVVQPGQGIRTVHAITALAALVGVLAGVTSVLHVGSTSVSGIVTAGSAAACTALAPMLIGSRSPVAVPGLLFLALAFGRALFAPDVDGLQNVAAYTILLLLPAFVALQATPDIADRVLRWFAASGLLATALFAVQQTLGLLTDGIRSYALAALPMLAAAAALRAGPWLLRIAPAVIVVGIVASLSRTASVVALLVLVVLVTRRPVGHRIRLAILAVVGAGATLAAVWTWVPSYRGRFTSGDNAMLGGVAINTSGRAKLWDVVADHARSAPLVGHGPGSAARLVTETFVGIRQPHNDWLRLLHDTGWIGVSLFALAAVTTLVRIARAAQRTDDAVHWAALAAFLALLVTAATDNTLIYPFAIGPTAVLIGLSLGSDARRDPPTSIPLSAPTTRHTKGP